MYVYDAERKAVPIVNVAVEEMGSGFSEALTTTATPTVFPEEEVVGQLYSFKVSNNEVILGTRNSSIMGQRIAVGIQPLAGAKYVCIAETTDVESQIVIELGVQGTYMHVLFNFLHIFETLCHTY